MYGLDPDKPLVEVGSLALVFAVDPTASQSNEAVVSSLGSGGPGGVDSAMDEPVSAISDPTKTPKASNGDDTEDDVLDSLGSGGDAKVAPFELYVNSALLRDVSKEYTAASSSKTPSLQFTVTVSSSGAASVNGSAVGVAVPGAWAITDIASHSNMVWAVLGSGATQHADTIKDAVFPGFASGDSVTLAVVGDELTVAVNGGAPVVAFTGVKADVRPYVFVTSSVQMAVSECAPCPYRFEQGSHVASQLELVSATHNVSAAVRLTSGPSGSAIATTRDTGGTVEPRLLPYLSARCAGDSLLSIRSKMTSNGFSPADVLSFLKACESLERSDLSRTMSGEKIDDAVTINSLEVLSAGKALVPSSGYSGVTMCDMACGKESCLVMQSPSKSEKRASTVAYKLPRDGNHGLESLLFSVGLNDSAVALGEVLDTPVIVEVLADGLLRWSCTPLSESRVIQQGSVSLVGVKSVLFRVRRVGATALGECEDVGQPLVVFQNVRFTARAAPLPIAQHSAADALIGTTVAVLPAAVSTLHVESGSAGEDGHVLPASVTNFSLESVAIGVVVSRVRGTRPVFYRIRVLNTETGVSYLMEAPINRVVTVKALYGANVTAAHEVALALWKCYAASSIQLARSALVSALAAWPQNAQMRLSDVGGESSVLALLKYVGATDLLQSSSADASSTTTGDANSMFTKLRGVLKRLLTVGDGVDVASSDAAVVGGHLVDQTVQSFVNAAQGVTPIMRESFHNTPASVCYGGPIRFPGSSHIFLYFDKKSNMSAPGQANCSFVVYRGDKPEHKQAHTIIKGETSTSSPTVQAISAALTDAVVSPNWLVEFNPDEPIVVAGDSLYWQFESASKEFTGVAGMSKNWGFKFHAMPVSGRWMSDRHVATKPSVDWGCWLLKFLLTEAFTLLQPGQVHNATLVNALLSYIKSRTASGKARDNVVMLLAQLLSSPWMFTRDSVPDMDALQALEDVVMKAVADASKSSSAIGMKYLPPRLLHLVELVVQRRAFMNDFTALQSASATPSVPATPVAAAAAVVGESSPVVDGDGTKLSAGWGTAVASTGAVASAVGKLRKRALERAKKANSNRAVWVDKPIAPKLLPASSATKPIDDVVLVREYAQCLLNGARPSDAVLCSAWADVYGSSKFIESNHPYRKGESVTGSVAIPGAKKLRVLLHPRCSTVDGLALVIEGAGKVICNQSGPTSATGEVVSWKQLSFEVLGDKLTYRFVVPDTDDNGAGLWGVGFTVYTDGLAAKDKEEIVKQRVDVIGHAVKPMVTRWDATMDGALCELARKTVEAGVQEEAFMTMLTMSPSRLCLRDERDVRAFSCLANVPVLQLRLRYALLQEFNRRLSAVMHCFEISNKYAWSTGNLLHSVGHCVFLDVKMGLLEHALQATVGSPSSGISTVYLSNFDASASAGRGAVSPDDSECIFVQAFNSLRSAESAAMRTTTDSGQHKVFEVKFRGEDGIDAGGVYREGLQRMVEDLFSDRFTLLLPCPNASRNAGDNVGSFVPNPKHTSSLSQEMLVFMGRLMGMSLRFKATLPFLFPSLVWKQIAGISATHDDLLDMDELYGQFIHAIRHCDKDFTLDNEPHAPVTTEAAFAESFPGLSFVVTTSAGETVDLIPGGAGVPVTLASRHRYCDMVEQYRLHEFDGQIAAIRRGLGHIVPIRTLSLFTWQEVEFLVAGRPGE